MLATHLDETLPKLAWVASLRPGRDEVHVWHGPRVEANDHFVCEAVWAGDYEEGRFDETPLVFGSGIRVQSEKVTIVSPGTTVDRLWMWTDDDRTNVHVSNSLIALLRQADTRPLNEYRDYARDLESIVDGLDAYERELPVRCGTLEVLYFDNLLWTGQSLSRIEKPPISRAFDDFSSYREFLSATARSLAENAASAHRTHRISPLTSVSKGYDSPAASVVAREIGCEEAVTIRQARSLRARSDSGREIGEALGLDVTEYDRDQAIGPSELRFWAAMGTPQDVNLGIFNYPESVCLFFTGFHGDKVWTTNEHDTSDRIVRGDTTGLGFTEERLYRGALHCPVPYWGIRKMQEIADISRSRAMAPWRLGNDYDRPIPRRIVEEAGISREAFGMTKSATSSEWRRLFPYTESLLYDFAGYVEAEGEDVTPVRVKRIQATIATYLSSITEKVPALKSCLPSMAPDVPRLQFHWAVDRLISQPEP